MIYIQKESVPDFFKKYVSENPTETYDSDSFQPFHKALREKLVAEQKGLCAYCCSKISVETSHNEHIEPRHKKDGMYSERSLDYENIIASCNTTDTCGRNKGNEFDEKRFISPLQENCERVFSYDPDGYMKGDEYTIALLNLNSYELKQARKSIYRSIMNMSESDIRLCYCSDQNSYWQFSNVIFWYLREFGIS